MLVPQLLLSIATSQWQSVYNYYNPSQRPVLLHHPAADKAPVGTFSPLLPPAIPLAVKSIYLNAHLTTGGDYGSHGQLPGNWPHHWPVQYPGSEKGYILGWAGIIQVDGSSFVFLGDPHIDSNGSKPPVATQTSFHYTASTSVFSFKAAQVHFNATFFSPVTPHDLKRMSLPLSYLSIDVDPRDLKKHNVSVYTDISAEWASGDSNAQVQWEYGVESAMGIYEVQRKDQLRFAEVGEQAEWGSAVYATDMGPGVTTASGENYKVRGEFFRKGKLHGAQDVNYRAINDHQPVFAFAKKVTYNSPSAVFAIGHIRDPYVNYVTTQGQVSRRGYWSSHFSTPRDAIAFWLQDHENAVKEGVKFDRQIQQDARRVSGKNYSAIVELSTRQAFATIEITGESDDDVLIFLKEISSNGDMSTVDVIFPMYPILTYTNPTLLKYLLEPLMLYSVSGLYPNRWTVHDLGTYPNATGYNGGNDEPMPVEEAGNMLWMILAYYQLTKDVAWVSKYYDILTQWTTYLIEDGLVPAEQLSTDDFAGTLSNQTNLAVKAIIGIGAMSELAKATGHWVDSIHYRGTAKAYVEEWYQMALTARDISHPHAKLAYQDEWSHGLLYNLFGDRVLNLELFDRQLYEWQSSWYWTQKQEYGVPLDSRHLWTKTDWEVFAAASASDTGTRDMFIDLLVAYLSAGRVNAAFPDLYETTTANFPGRDGLDFPIQFISRPVVGGHFALLALDVANKANGVKLDPFRGKPKGKSLSKAPRWAREYGM
ncbi:glutaminase GtaA [Meredithblackwellia eburnea MCA 4105]